MPQPRIFVSHSHKDDAFTQRLVNDLHQAGAEVWVDVAGIRHGNFLQRIDETLAHCDWLAVETPLRHSSTSPKLRQIQATSWERGRKAPVGSIRHQASELQRSV